jgi:hypothetical protein
MVHGTSPGHRVLLVSAYIASLIGGAAVVGVGLAVVGSTIPPFQDRAAVSVMVAVQGVLVLREMGIARIPLPERHWAVPRHWQCTLPPLKASAGYGLLLGSGVATRIPSSSFYGLLGWTLIDGHPVWAFGWFAAFGVGRAVPVLLRIALDARGADGMFQVDRLMATEPAVRVVMAGLCSIAAGLALSR